MKAKCLISIIFFLLFKTLVVSSQEIIEKTYLDLDKELGKDVVIKKSTIKVDGSKCYKIFEIE